MRLSIEITPDQHQKLKALAALQGKSIKDYVLERTLPDADQAAALRELEDFLEARLEAARRGQWSEQTVDEIVAETLLEAQSS
ncbi:MAG: DUF1778 domain-containing protein [Rhodospirillaceae bacterium]|nr:DUF1778 domain-containing protein [Rhodospirillaceae bacterium]